MQGLSHRERPRERFLRFFHVKSSTFIPIQSSISSVQILGIWLSTRYIVHDTPGVSYCWHSRWPIIERFGLDRSSRAEIVSRYGSMSSAANVPRIVIVLVGIIEQISRMLLNDVLLMLSGSLLLVDRFSFTCVRVNNHLFDNLRWLIVGIENVRFLRMKRMPSRGTRADVTVGVFVVQSLCAVRMVSRPAIIGQAWRGRAIVLNDLHAMIIVIILVDDHSSVMRNCSSVCWSMLKRSESIRRLPRE